MTLQATLRPAPPKFSLGLSLTKERNLGCLCSCRDPSPTDRPCWGGRAGRRRLLGHLEEPGRFCPVTRSETRPPGKRIAAAPDLSKLESACTTIIVAR